jgi:predicted phage terminase large subunit-like protein
MSDAVFTVLILTLREPAERPWLSATFTPKGKDHWTYRTFAGSRPDTAMFHCTTRDNLFLPPDFYQNVRQHLTSVQAEQELEGRFVDAGGALFQRRWFAVVDKVPPMVALCRAWDLAATPEDDERARDPDWTAGVKMGRGVDGTFYVLNVARVRESPLHVEELVRDLAIADGPGCECVMEQEGGAAGKMIADAFLRRIGGLAAFHAVPPTGSKASRAMPLAAQAEGGLVKLLRADWNEAFLDEAESFPCGRHDDQIDAAALSMSRLAWRGTQGGFPVALTGGYLTDDPSTLERAGGPSPYAGGNVFDDPYDDPIFLFGRPPSGKQSPW